MVLAARGDERTEESLAQALGAYWYGTPASYVTRVRTLGYTVRYEQTTFEQLQHYLDQGIVCIVFLRTGELPYWSEDVSHAVVLVGSEGDHVYVHDPALDDGPTTIDRLTFLLAWSELDYYCATITNP